MTFEGAFVGVKIKEMYGVKGNYGLFVTKYNNDIKIFT